METNARTYRLPFVYAEDAPVTLPGALPGYHFLLHTNPRLTEGRADWLATVIDADGVLIKSWGVVWRSTSMGLKCLHIFRNY